jgi:hypothetical protein
MLSYSRIPIFSVNFFLKNISTTRPKFYALPGLGSAQDSFHTPSHQVGDATRSSSASHSTPPTQTTPPTPPPNTSQTSSQPQWEIIAPTVGVTVTALGIFTAVGFFGKVVHDESLETRRELKDLGAKLDARIETNRREAREDINKLYSKLDELENKFNELENIITSPKPSK